MRYIIIPLLILLPLIAWPEEATKTTTGGAGQSFNPDISVIGDFLGHYSNKAADGFTLREVELGLASYVDPYSRADIFLGIDPANSTIDVEEAYFTFLTLPYNLQARVGRYRLDFGRVNAMHGHALPWVEYPLMIRNYLGEEGLAGDGVSVSWLAPTEHYVDFTYETFNNRDNPLSGIRTGNHLSQLLHAKNYWDLSEESTLQIGLSGMWLPEQYGRSVNAESLDMIYRWRPVREGKYRSFMWQAEALAAQKEEPLNKTVKTTGAFTAVDYQFGQRWFVGGRFDYSELPDDAAKQEREYSTALTFAQSEYAYWRLSYSVTKSDVAEHNNERQVYLQLNIGIGPHRAHTY